MASAIILVIKTGADDPIDRLFETLRDDPAITLVAPHPVGADEGVRIIGARDDVQAVLIISREPDIPALVARVRAVRKDLHIIALAIESGTASLSLRDPSFEELNRVVHSLVEPAPQNRRASGKILKFRARLPVAREVPLRRNLPVPLKAEVDPKAVDVLELALNWVETATQILLKIWSGKRDDTPGFALSWEALERWLAEFVRIGETPAAPAECAFDRLVARLESQDGAATPLATIAELLGRDPLALKFFLIAMAGDLDIRFHRLFGALHDDFGRPYPSLGLACAIIAAATDRATPLGVRAQLAALERFRGLNLIGAVGDTIGSADEPLRVSPTLVDWLMTGDAEKLVGAEAAHLHRELPEEAIALVSEDRRRRLRRAIRQALVGRGERGVSAVMLSGSDAGWLAVEAVALAGPAILVAPPATEQARDILEAGLRTLATAAQLSGKRLVVDLSGGATASDALWQALSELLGLLDRRPYIVADSPAQRLAALPDDRVVVANLPAPRGEDREWAVAAALARQGPVENVLAARIADAFPIPIDTIPDAVALSLSAAASSGRPGRPDAADWFAGFRLAAGARLPQLARRIEPSPCPEEEEFSCLDAVVLPDTQRRQLEELVKHVRFSRTVLDDWGFGELVDAEGVAALFSGESGTGKTSAAHAIASELKADLYAIDLSRVVSKYIGETESNLDSAFADAEKAKAVLLFDEADALFGKRSAVSDAHDRYANIEVAYLLQRMQRFRGLAILTTNNAENLDSAFTRRLRFAIAFPRPGPGDRTKIWEQSIPDHLRGGRLPLRQLAVALDVTGGTIRQMALHAAVLAAEDGDKIFPSHVLAGARSQLVRLGLFGDLAKLETVAREPSKEAA